MTKFKHFALNRPFLFGILLIFIYALSATIVYPINFLFPDSEVGQLYSDTTAKVIVFSVLLLILWRFGWIRASGIARLGAPRFWIIVVAILVFKILSELYAFTGDLSVALPNTPLGVANAIYYLPSSLVEETMYRALVLVAMISAWGDTKRGQIKAVLLSSLIFGLLHMLNAIVNPFGTALLQAIVVTLPGILYSALVLTSRSLWPAIVIHWLTNAAVNIKMIGIEGYQETFSMWVTYAVLLIPLMIYSAYLISKLPEPYEYETGGVT